MLKRGSKSFKKKEKLAENKIKRRRIGLCFSVKIIGFKNVKMDQFG